MQVALLINTHDQDYPHYHRETDTPASLDYGLMAAIGKVTASTVAKWAHPSWAHADADGGTGAGRHSALERSALERGAEGVPAGMSLADAIDEAAADDEST